MKQIRISNIDLLSSQTIHCFGTKMKHLLPNSSNTHGKGLWWRSSFLRQTSTMIWTISKENICGSWMMKRMKTFS